MRRALALAARGGRPTAPNPMVGCVLVKGGRVVGEGWHQYHGGPHAEAVALARAGRRARGATAFVTLEPCCVHPGKKTPPCAPALAEAGVRRVVAAMKDPNPGVSNRGFALLRRAGVRVDVGLLGDEAVELNRGFVWRMRHRRPFVILKTALSLDGKAAARGGASKWITGPQARAEARRLRGACDAVLVGVGTVLADDPRLTARNGGPEPLRVVLDSELRIPRKAKILNGDAKTVIFTASRKTLPGTEIVRVPRGKGGVSIYKVLEELSRRGIGTMLLEGGPQVHASFLEAGLVDEARVFFSPKLLAGSRDPNRSPFVESPRLKQTGQDFLFYGRVRCSPGSFKR